MLIFQFIIIITNLLQTHIIYIAFVGVELSKLRL
jgi:hypothetical protein